MKHVVIVGGGFAGLNCARKLAANPNVRITLLDKNNYHQFQPLLYQVATGTLSPDNIAFNLRFTLLQHPNVEVKMTEVVSIDPHLADGRNRSWAAISGRFSGAGCGLPAKLFRHAGSTGAQLSPVLAARRGTVTFSHPGHARICGTRPFAGC